MGQGDSSHTPFDPKGGLVPYRTGKQRPLLPWEREIIDLLGCSVDEYRWFVEETTKRARTRPAEYALIPDIVNDPATLTSIIVSLVVGAIFTGVSYLLTPKPRMPSQDRGGGQRNLASRQGTERFAQTTGFDSIADIAAYGEPIPIVWTKWTGETGGVLISPKLVWSRLFSRGTQQDVKLLFVVGESGIQPPDLAGIYIGNNGLDTLLSNNYAFWWNTSSRIQRSDLKYGTQGGALAGDQQPQSDILYNPVGPGAFCHAYTPSNNTQFGISNAIPNGTQYRVNWRVVSVPDSLDIKVQLYRDRAKISGYGRDDDPDTGRNQIGVGLNYPRRQGIEGATKTTITASVGTVIQFVISGVKLRDYLFGGDPSKVEPDKRGGGEVEDINNALDAECSAADDILQIGEDVMIGGSIWRVTARSIDSWNPGLTQNVTLQCIEVVDDARVGVPGTANYVNTEWIVRNNENLDRVIGLGYWPLTRYAFGVIKNTRPCHVTQVGFRSNVWGRFNGLCNFNSLPRGGQIARWDAKDVTVNTGTMTEYFKRTSVFTVHWRELGATNWVRTNQYFAISGSQPIDQFRGMSFEHGAKRALEFRFVPIPAAVTTRFSDSTTIYLLSGSGDFSVSGNGITIRGGGQAVVASSIKVNPQMIERGTTSYVPPSVSKIPTSLIYQGVGADYAGEFQVWARARTGINPESASVSEGNVYTATFTLAKGAVPSADGRVITVQVTLQVIRNAQGRKLWNTTPLATTIVSANSGLVQWEVGNTVPDNVVTTAPYQIGTQIFPAGTAAGVRYVVGAVKTTSTGGTVVNETDRVFEEITEIAEVSYYGSLITRSCDSSFEHQITYVNEIVGLDNSANAPTYADLTTAGLALRSRRNLGGIDQVRCWISNGITSSNSFPELVRYLLENINGVSTSLLDTASFTTARDFCANRKLFFDGVISERVNIRTYIAELAPFFLLNFVIANGKFSLQPAIPSSATPPISQIFTANNIIDGSLRLEYLPADQRRDFQALMTYRTHAKNQLPVVRTFRTRFASSSPDVPVESFDMSAYCTSRQHAQQVARYFLSLRKRVTHSIQFKTAPEGAGIAPGSYIKVALEQTAVSNFSNGIINNDGSVVSPQPLANGSYSISYYVPGSEDLSSGTLVLTNGLTAQTELFGAIFTLTSSSIVTSTYLIEQIELDEEGLVNVTATEFPAALILADMSGTDMVEYDE